MSIYRQYCELVDSLSRQIVEHCGQIISTTIVHDAESHYWQDSKDYYEVSTRIKWYSLNLNVGFL